MEFPVTYRGKRKVINDWVYGYLHQCSGQYLISAPNKNTVIEIVSFTLAIHTGQSDVNGVKIYTGDFIKSTVSGAVFEIRFEDGAFTARDEKGILQYKNWKNAKIVGNIFDNKITEFQ